MALEKQFVSNRNGEWVENGPIMRITNKITAIKVLKC